MLQKILQFCGKFDGGITRATCKGGGDLVELSLTIDSGAGGGGCITLGINRCKGKGMSDGEGDAVHPFNFVAKRLYGAGFSEITVRHCSFHTQYHGRDAALP